MIRKINTLLLVAFVCLNIMWCSREQKPEDKIKYSCLHRIKENQRGLWWYEHPRVINELKTNSMFKSLDYLMNDEIMQGSVISKSYYHYNKTMFSYYSNYIVSHESWDGYDILIAFKWFMDTWCNLTNLVVQLQNWSSFDLEKK